MSGRNERVAPVSAGPKGRHRRRWFLATIVAAWAALLAITAANNAKHVLIVPAWGVLIAVVGFYHLIDTKYMIHVYRRSMPASVSIAYIRGLVTFSGGALVIVGSMVGSWVA